MKSVCLPPYAPTLIEATRAIGYTLEAAIADIIDNSISAFASSIDIFFFPVGDAYIAMLDDGIGMNDNEIELAMRYGSRSPNSKREASDLGRFGLGLKTASLSQCRVLTVVTKRGSYMKACRWDIDYVISTNDWSLLVFDTEKEFDKIPQINELKKYDSGTLVVWQNLDRLNVGEIDFNRSMTKKMDDVRSHVSLVFHRYLAGELGIKKLQMKINNYSVIPVDPFLSKRNTQVMADEILDIEGKKVVIRPYILPHISNLTVEEISLLGGKEGLRKSQGFYVYRNKRLLVWGTWFRMMRQAELSKLVRVQIDIPNELDELWTLDIKKSTAVPPEEVRNNLDSIIERLAEHSKRTWVFRGKKESCDSIIHVWQRSKGRHGGVFYTINREHPLLKMFSGRSGEVNKNIEDLLKIIETSLPLNTLYLDLTADKTIENELEVNEEELERMLLSLLTQMTTNKAKSDLVRKLEKSDLFVNYPKLINKYKFKGDANDKN